MQFDQHLAPVRQRALSDQINDCLGGFQVDLEEGL